MTSPNRVTSRLGAIVVGLVMTATAADAQPRRPKAAVTPLVATDGVRTGESVRLALGVSLPKAVHVQADKPRDPFLIPTALTFELPAGISVTEVVYPKPTDLVQSGQTQPLAVFEQDFVIGVQLSVDRTVAPGEVLVPAHLRYQACDATTCYPPAAQATSWTLRVVPTGTPTPARDQATFDQIRFR